MGLQNIIGEEQDLCWPNFLLIHPEPLHHFIQMKRGGGEGGE